MGRWKKEVKEVEVVADGVIRDAGAENPLADNDLGKKPRIEGNWIKVSFDEMANLEASGKLLGYDPDKGEALVK